MSDAVLAPLRETAELLRSLGHEVVDHQPEYGELRTIFGPLWVTGIEEDARTLIAGTRQLERRTRQMIALGRRTPASFVARAKRDQAALVQRLAPTFERFDVLLTAPLARPPVEAGRWEGRSAIRTFLGIAAWTPGTATWNITGQPAAVVPSGFTPDGLPLTVQLVGRHHDEETLFSLAAQIERERPWADARPEL
jgi:amidase